MPKKGILLILSVTCFIIFVYFSYLVAKERFTQFDFDTTVKFQDRLSKKVDLPFSILSLLGSVEISGFIWLVLLIYTLIRRFWLTFLAMFLLPLALIIEVFGKVFLFHPGPPFLFYRGVLKFNFPSHFIQTDFSYPSGHVLRTTFLIIFLMTYLYLRHKFFKPMLVQITLVIFLLLMVVSRIYLGEHWTTDVVGGFLLGASLGLFTGITVPYKKISHPLTAHP